MSLEKPTVIVLSVLDVKEADSIQAINFGTRSNRRQVLNLVGFVRGMFYSHSPTILLLLPSTTPSSRSLFSSPPYPKEFCLRLLVSDVVGDCHLTTSVRPYNAPR